MTIFLQEVNYSLKELHRLDVILNLFFDHLSEEDKQMIWQFERNNKDRRNLTRAKKL